MTIFSKKFRSYVKGVMTLSLKEAVLSSLSGYYKPDNAYWNDFRRKAFWYRIIVLTTIMMIFVSSLAITRDQYPWKLIGEEFEQAKKGFPMIAKDFPLRLIAYPRMWWAMSNNGTSKDDVAKALGGSQANRTMQQLLRTNLQFSEVGGALFLKDGALAFYQLDNPNRKMALEINSVLKDESQLKAAYGKYREMIRDKSGSDIAIAKLSSKIAKSPDDIVSIRRLLMHFVFISGSEYAIDPDSLTELFYDGFKGHYLGQFHVHKMGEPPSRKDLESSQIDNVFVLSEIVGYKATFYWLKGGQIYLEKEITR